MTPDFTKMVRQALITANVASTVYGQRFPEGTVTFPAVRVTTLSTVPATHPAPSWWEGLVQVDVFNRDDVAGLATAADVQDALYDLTGTTVGDVVVQDVKPPSAQYLDDQNFKPPVGRWIITAAITARVA